jgi:ubiquinone/menaquinone biosynthesis C-methylase UbiE
MDATYFFLALIVAVLYGVTMWHSSIEGFEDGSTSVTYEDAKDIYDDVYAAIYNLLWHPNEQLKYEQVSIHDIALAEKPVTAIKVLDMACGTAPHACYFKTLGVDYVGVDLSDGMLNQARKDCATATFQNGDVTQAHMFPPKSASTCLLLGFGVYDFQNPKVLADNAYQWLTPEGVFVVHMVDPDKFDPLLDLASPFAAFSLQKYALERQTESVVYFDQFKYAGKFDKKTGEDRASFNETLSYYDPSTNHGVKYRENKHHLTMPSKERLIDLFKTSGFRHLETVDLVRCGKEYQYLVYFTK